MADINVQHLAQLARISLTDEEALRLSKDMESILSYVEEIQRAPIDLERTPDKTDPRNILREDQNPYIPGTFKDGILREAPQTESGYVKVKKIL